VDITKNEQKSKEHLALNPIGAVPVYVEAQFVLTQSGAILNYLTQRWQPWLIPKDVKQRALVDASCHVAVSDIAVQNALLRNMDFDRVNVSFLQERLLDAIRAAFISTEQSKFLFGDELTIADLAHYPVIHMRRALLEVSGDFEHVLNWADQVRTFEPVARAIAYSALELPAQV